MNLQDTVVTILLPVQNAGKYLSECLESLRDQTYTDIQIIAVDDRSRDNSYDILKKFKRNFKNMEIIKNKKRYGLAICYNRAMRLAKGRFVAFMNPNDISAPNRFKRQVNFLTKNPKFVAVGTQYTSINTDNKKLDRSNMPQDHEDIYDTLLQASSLYPETTMINRKLLPKDLLYFKSSKYPIVFTEVFVKLFQYGKVANITHSLYYQRTGILRHGRRTSRFKQMRSVLKLWFTSRTNYDYHPPLRSIFPQILKTSW